MPEVSVLNQASKNSFGFMQVLPYEEPEQYDMVKGHPKDRAFSLVFSSNNDIYKGKKLTHVTNIVKYGVETEMELLERGIRNKKSFVACVNLIEGLSEYVNKKSENLILSVNSDIETSIKDSYEEAYKESKDNWKVYWNKSAVALQDKFLERVWYHNLYFFNSSVREGATCPGLFANWSYRNIGTEWHGDYHMNYNTQQPFWLTFSSNHLDKHMPYIDLVYKLLPISKKWAEEYHEKRGANFPHTAFPVELTVNPYCIPDMCWEVCETPWSVQSLWWHYIYTKDKTFLRDRAMEPIREVVKFLIDYMKYSDINKKQWTDGKYHIYPSVPPEIYGWGSGVKLYHDNIADLTFTKFIFKAYLEAIKELKIEREEKEIALDVEDILSHFPEYPKGYSEKYGEVFVSVPGEHTEAVYNLPLSTITVFPGEEHGLHSSKEEYDIAVSSYKNQKNEGGNEIVILNLQAARLGILDLEKFKRQIKYCLLPNGTCADNILQSQGRYGDTIDFSYMTHMGIWFENFALPVVINECLMQSYNGEIRLFPNWPKNTSAEFRDLRGVGAFLVSASFKHGKVNWVEIKSEAGSELKFIFPWGKGAKYLYNGEARTCNEETINIKTKPGETIRLTYCEGNGI